MKLEEAIERLSKFANIEILYGKHLLITTSQQHDIKEAINTSLQHIKHLQKENEELRKLEKDHNYSVQVIIENSKLRYELAHSVNCEKIGEKIKEVKNKPNNPNQKVVATQIDASLIACLEELLKEE